MEELVPIIMIGVVPIFLIFFLFYRNNRTVLAGFLFAWLFLPIQTYEIVGLPDYNKITATVLGIGIGILLLDIRRIFRFRPHWADLPMLIWCFVPVAASVSNGLGVYDGLSESLDQVISWGVPWFIGRLYFKSWSDMRSMALGLIIAGIIYLPLLLFEMRMSPQLHNLVYGFHQHKFEQTMRFGGWRPMVFMNHGLMVAFMVASIAIITSWTWYAGTFRTIFKVPTWIWAIVFILLTVFMRSVNAWIWLSLGLPLLFFSHRFKTKIFVWILLGVIPIYVFANMVDVWPEDTAVRIATGIIGPVRAQSLEFRYFNENHLMEKAWDRILFGWAGWDRQHVFFEWGPAKTVADSLWIIVLGKFGLLGLVSLMTTLFMPMILYIRRYSPWTWAYPTAAPGAALCVVLLLYLADGMVNAMVNPLYMLVAGAVISTCVGQPLVVEDDKPVGNVDVPLPFFDWRKPTPQQA